MICYLLHSGCGLCYNEEYDQQIREDVKDMKKEDEVIQSWKQKKARHSSKEMMKRSKIQRARFAGYGDEEYSEYDDASAPQPYRMKVRPRKVDHRRWDSSAVTMSARQIQAENNLLQRNLRAAQKELLAQDKMIIHLESDLQVNEIERAKLEDKLYMMQLDLEDARTALRQEVLKNQENERLLQEYQKLEKEQRRRQERWHDKQRQREQVVEQRQDEQSWFSPWSWK